MYISPDLPEGLEAKTVVSGEYHVFEGLIQTFYDVKEYDIPCQEEKGNDISIEYDLDGKMNEWELTAARDFLLTKKPKHYFTRTYLNYLVFCEKLPPGTYLIDIS